MPVYNGEKYCREAIESILSQTYRHFEFLIVDDCSTDNTWKIIEEYRIQNPDIIKTIKLSKRVGAYAAANKAFLYAKGDFIAPMDSDDISHPKRLEKQIEFMHENPEIIILGVQAQVINSKGDIIGNKNVPLIHQDIYNEFGVINPIIHPSCLIRRNLLPNKKRIYENKFGVNSDYYTFFKWLNYGEFANLPIFLLKYRIHEGNSSFKKPKEKFINSLKIRLKAIAEFKFKISITAILLMLIQSIIVLLLPEKYIVPLYLYIHSIRHPKEIFPKYNFTPQNLFSRVQGAFLNLFL